MFDFHLMQYKLHVFTLQSIIIKVINIDISIESKVIFILVV